METKARDAEVAGEVEKLKAELKEQTERNERLAAQFGHGDSRPPGMLQLRPNGEAAATSEAAMAVVTSDSSDGEEDEEPPFADLNLNPSLSSDLPLLPGGVPAAVSPGATRARDGLLRLAHTPQRRGVRQELRNLAAECAAALVRSGEVMTVQDLVIESPGSAALPEQVHAAMNWLVQRNRALRVHKSSWRAVPRAPERKRKKSDKRSRKEKRGAARGSFVKNGSGQGSRGAAVSDDWTPLMRLNETVKLMKLQPPEFHVVKEEGPAHSRTFTMSVSFKGQVYTASAKSKKQCKHTLAALALAGRGSPTQLQPSPTSHPVPPPRADVMAVDSGRVELPPHKMRVI